MGAEQMKVDLGPRAVFDIGEEGVSVGNVSFAPAT